MNRNSKRNNALSAASFIVKNHGVEKLTLEAVAKEAGISKGGLLHHFPNKQALIRGLVEELTDNFVTDVNNRAANATTSDGKWSRAYLEATFNDITEGNEMSTALIASLFTSPDLLAKLQSEYLIWQKNIENDGIDPVKSTLVRLAADGLWLSEMFGLGKLNDDLREKVIRSLKDLTE
ncbi:TetR/AcrR family transcriptional regulator [Paenibacillus solisilvae]|uniref:TetR/AcrR family transcriptional regulator n=1 Tax=Paenibacillus solisilvae TaxID=2486751 RepID=A0ABW0VUI6_9BACL